MLGLADRLYGSHLLGAADAHTIECEVGQGATYIPIPSGQGENLAGLVTIDLPPSVRTGEEFEVVVRRIATRRLDQKQPPPREQRPPIREAVERPEAVEKGSAIELNEEIAEVKPAAEVPSPAKGEVPRRRVANWRYVVGTFAIRIPVENAGTMLVEEENTLAIMRWRLQRMSDGSRWYRVLQRYVSYLADRVRGLGGDPDSIEGSPSGVLPSGLRHRGYWEASEGAGGGEREAGADRGRVESSGKVSRLLYDRFGDFEGFVLETEQGEVFFAARESEIEEVVRRAWAGRVLTTVYADPGERGRPLEIVLEAPPPPRRPR